MNNELSNLDNHSAFVGLKKLKGNDKKRLLLDFPEEKYKQEKENISEDKSLLPLLAVYFGDKKRVRNE